MTQDIQSASAALTGEAADTLAEAERAIGTYVDRRQGDRRMGRGAMRSIDTPANAWSVSQLAYCIGMSTEFVRQEIRLRELQASSFGGEYRIAIVEVVRYLDEKQFPKPQWMDALVPSVKEST